MFFQKKTCKSCQDKAVVMERLQEQIVIAEQEISRLREVVAKLQAEYSAKPNTSNFEEINKESLQKEAYDKVDSSTPKRYLMSEEDRERLLKKRAALKDKTGPNSEELSQDGFQKEDNEGFDGSTAKRYVMSEENRAQLLKKRAALKARIGPNSEETLILRRHKDREEQIEKIRQACEQHFPALARNFRHSQVYNDYGALTSDGRVAECIKFLDSLKNSEGPLTRLEAIGVVLSTVKDLSDKQVSKEFSSEDHPDDGWEFERWVADALIKFGWQARVTQGSGDQGVDVVAIKDGMSLGIQCKRYSGSVGNKAVQEAFSGVKHMGLDLAAVLTNAEFTRSAKELATSTGVLLLSPEDIPTLSERPELKR